MAQQKKIVFLFSQIIILAVLFLLLKKNIE